MNAQNEILISNRDCKTCIKTLKDIISREKIFSTIINAPCLTCNVEQKCTLEGEVSPRTCQLINDWVLIKTTRSKSKK